MSVLKIQKLLKSLSVKELEQLEWMVYNQKRQSQKKLYKLLKKNISGNKSIQKEKAFKQVFGRLYKEDEDYLFRNELRLLTERVASLIIESESAEAIKNNPSYKDYLLLKGYYSKKLFQELESHFYKFYNYAIEQLEFYYAHQMARLYFNYLMLHKEISPLLLQEAHTVLRQDMQNLKQLYKTEGAINQHGRVASENALKVLQHPVDSTVLGTDLAFKGIENPHQLFFEAASRANQNVGEEKVKHAQEAKRQIAKVAHIYPTNMVDSLAILAGAFYQLADYWEAKSLFEEALDFGARNKLAVRVDILFNYCSILMKLKDYGKVIDAIQLHQSEIDDNLKVRFRFECFHCFCYIFKGEHEKVINIIPANIGKRPETEYQYFRFIYCILPYLRNDYEGGLREATNFVSYFNRKKASLSFYHEKELALIYKRFYHALLKYTSKSQISGVFNKLLNEVTSFTVQYPIYKDYQYVLWLRETLQSKQ